MGNVEHGGGEVHVEQLGHDGRMLQYAVDESVDFCSCELLDGQADGVWFESASLDFGLDGGCGWKSLYRKGLAARLCPTMFCRSLLT